MVFGRLSGRGANSTPKENQNTKELVKARDIKIIEGYARKIKPMISLEKHDDITIELRGAFEVWMEISALRQKNDVAEIVLSAVYQNGKINDYLKKLSVFIERIDDLDTAETARNMGYYNYVFFIRQFIDDMQDKCTEKIREMGNSTIKINPDNVIWFIRSECAGMASIKDLPKAYEAILRLEKNAKEGASKTTEIKQDLAEVSGYIELLGEHKETIDDIEILKGNLRQRISEIKKNIDKGKKIYRLLTETMTNEWFDQFNPESESCAVLNAAKDELKKFYSKEIQPLHDKLSVLN